MKVEFYSAAKGEKHRDRKRVGSREINLCDYIGKGPTVECLRLDNSRSNQQIYLTYSVHVTDDLNDEEDVREAEETTIMMPSKKMNESDGEDDSLNKLDSDQEEQKYENQDIDPENPLPRATVSNFKMAQELKKARDELEKEQENHRTAKELVDEQQLFLNELQERYEAANAKAKQLKIVNKSGNGGNGGARPAAVIGSYSCEIESMTKKLAEA
jgi:hypothetical protein